MSFDIVEKTGAWQELLPAVKGSNDRFLDESPQVTR
jgi:hypothetical protein